MMTMFRTKVFRVNVYSRNQLNYLDFLCYNLDKEKCTKQRETEANSKDNYQN